MNEFKLRGIREAISTFFTAKTLKFIDGKERLVIAAGNDTPWSLIVEIEGEDGFDFLNTPYMLHSTSFSPNTLKGMKLVDVTTNRLRLPKYWNDFIRDVVEMTNEHTWDLMIASAMIHPIEVVSLTTSSTEYSVTMEIGNWRFMVTGTSDKPVTAIIETLDTRRSCACGIYGYSSEFGVLISCGRSRTNVRVNKYDDRVEAVLKHL